MKIEIETFDDFSAKITFSALGSTFEERWSNLDEESLYTEGDCIEAQIAKKYPEMQSFIHEIIAKVLGGIDIEDLIEIHHELEVSQNDIKECENER